MFVSCLLGVGISFTGFGLRELVTATTFTVMGVMNKMLTVLISIALFANATSLMSVGGLIGSIAGGTLYQQAPPRAVIMSDEETRLVKEETREEKEGEEESKATRSRAEPDTSHEVSRRQSRHPDTTVQSL